MSETYRQQAIELIEWLEDHAVADPLEAVAEVSRRLEEVARKATEAEADQWEQKPLKRESDSWPCVWEMT